MSRKDKDKYAEKYPAGRKTVSAAVEAVKAKTAYGTIPCAIAFQIAADLQLPPEEIGFTLDKLNVRITKCQLGLFGNTPISKIVQPASAFDPAIEGAIRAVLTDGVSLDCAKAWEIAAMFKVPRMFLSGVCEALGIKITKCQLNAF